MRRTALHALSAVALGLSLATSAGAETLGEAMRAALAENAGLKAQRANTDAAGHAVIGARAGLLPKVTGTYRANASKSGAGDYPDWTDNSSISYSLAAEQPIFQSGAAIQRLRKAKAQASSAEFKYLNSQQELMLNTGRTYVGAVRDQNVLKHRRQYLAAVKEELGVARRRFELGESTRTDVELAQARQYEAEAVVAAAEGAVQQSIAQLEAYAGTTNGNYAWPDFPANLLPTSVADAIELALNNNPEIAEKSESLRAARYGVWADTATFGPQVNATASYTKQYDEDHEQEQGAASVGLAVEVPLFNGGRGYGAYKTARDTERQQDYLLQDARVQITQSVTAAASQMKASQLRLKSAKAAVSANERVLKGLKAEFQQGERSLSDVISGRSSLADSQASLEEARYNLWVSGLTLLNAMGQLTPDVFYSGSPRPARREVPPNLFQQAAASDVPVLRGATVSDRPFVTTEASRKKSNTSSKRKKKSSTASAPLRLSSQ